MPKNTDKSEYDNKEYEKIGKMMADIYETSHANRKEIYKMSFVKGLIGGLAGVIGATVMVALVLWALTFFKRVPLIGPVAEKIRTTIQVKRPTE